MNLEKSLSRTRRVAVIALYELVLAIVLVVLCNAVVSEACRTQSACSSDERSTVKMLVLGWIAAAAWALVYGWRGRLIGARAQPEPTQEERHQ